MCCQCIDTVCHFAPFLGREKYTLQLGLFFTQNTLKYYNTLVS